jgi:glycine cleavage system H protein
MTLPADRLYTTEHEWLDIDGDIAVVGVTAFAADALGDVVYLELPQVGARLSAGQPCGEIESTKSVSDLYAPVDGEVLEVNHDAVANPTVLNLDPYDAGWLLRIRVDSAPALLDVEAYAALTGQSA